MDAVICITLSGIKKHGPCSDEFKRLLNRIGMSEEEDNQHISMETIIDSNGIDEAIWCLCAVSGHDKEIRLFAVWCARQVQHLMTDKRSVDAIDVAEQHALGAATEDDLRAAFEEAWNSALHNVHRSACVSESSAAWAAVWAAAKRDEAGGSVWAAARAAVRAAERLEARDVALAAQEAEFRRVFCGEEDRA